MAGRWGKRVRRSGVDGRDKRRVGGRKRSAGGSVLRGAVGRGAQGWMPRGGRVEEREGALGVGAVAARPRCTRCALPRDSGGRRGRRDAGRRG
jgi:hypothetical protein